MCVSQHSGYDSHAVNGRPSIVPTTHHSPLTIGRRHGAMCFGLALLPCLRVHTQSHSRSHLYVLPPVIIHGLRCAAPHLTCRCCLPRAGRWSPPTQPRPGRALNNTQRKAFLEWSGGHFESSDLDGAVIDRPARPWTMHARHACRQPGKASVSGGLGLGCWSIDRIAWPLCV